ncbi:hypothetical protein [Streptomyces sp. NPDC059398]|uniref:hypothetical protein n=1 Tax=Streptomyces sp. NPDC059398 TaxID=3346820 RepID=UPI00367DF79A
MASSVSRAPNSWPPSSSRSAALSSASCAPRNAAKAVMAAVCRASTVLRRSDSSCRLR